MVVSIFSSKCACCRGHVPGLVSCSNYYVPEYKHSYGEVENLYQTLRTKPGLSETAQFIQVLGVEARDRLRAALPLNQLKVQPFVSGPIVQQRRILS